MKIAFINIYQNSTERGSEIFVKELSKRLSLKHTVQIIGSNLSTQSRWPILWRLYLDHNGLQILWFTLKNIPFLVKENFDVIIPLNGGWQPAIVRVITWVLRKKMVIVGQSGLGWDDRNNIFCFPDRFVALSSRAKEWAHTLLPVVKTSYIPNGVDSTTFTPHGKKYEHGLSNPVVLCVAALVPSKHIDLTIQAVSRIKKLSLLIVGKGPLKSEVERLGKDLLGERFKLISAHHTDMPNIYRSAQYFTLVSETSEAFGIVYAEALASNLPIIATDDKQRREIIGDAGVYTDFKLENYTVALEKALSTKFGSKPRKQSEKFNWNIIAHEYENLFSELCKR